MTKHINYLIENNDIASVEEFNEVLTNNKQDFIEHLNWRISGGLMKNEKIKHYNEYLNACSELLKIL